MNDKTTKTNDARDKATPDEAARFVVRTLVEAGHVALYAGGCVRDRLLGREPNDIDVATNARPDVVKGLFRRTLKVGEQFGIVIVLYRGEQVEVATFRADGDYSDGRRPDTVAYTDDPKEDAQRRDFTVNGLFYDPLEDEVHDFVDGVADIEAGLIRAIGDPAKRFDEDKLRLLRAPRFAAQLGFAIEPQTADCARHRAPEIETSGVSPERIHVELSKLLTCSGRARGWALCVDLAQVPVVLPEAVGAEEAAGRTLAALPETISIGLAWAAVLRHAGPKATDQALRRLKASNKEREAAAALVGQLPQARELAALDVAVAKRLMRKANVPDLTALLRASLTADDQDTAPADVLAERYAAFAADDGPAGLAARPLVMGKDLSKAGLKPGKLFGRVLPQVEDAQLRGQVTTKADALALALQLAAE